MRLSDREVELIDECRETMYGENASDVPRGMVIGNLAERFQQQERYL